MTSQTLRNLLILGSLTFAPFTARAEDASDQASHEKQEKVDDGKHHQVLKGAAAGAVAGHFAGHHAIKGAIVGATAGAIKRHYDKKEAKKREADRKAAEQQGVAH